MTSNPTHDSNKTLQIALVGVRPADQVMLKGYMRVILRLETGLEWVSANHPSVDFYIVNYEFAQADSVQKLLAAQPNAAVLYVQRDETKGGMVDNVLTLPLKELDQLKYWLASHIDSLRDDYHANSPSTPATPVLANTQSQANATPATQSRMTLDEIIANRAKNPTNAQTNIFNTAQPSAYPAQTQEIATPSDENLLALFRQFHTTGDRLFSLTKDGELMAYVHPERQRIWIVKNLAVFTPDLKVIANNHDPILDNQPSEDLVQWLWAKTFDMPMADISLLVKNNVPYHITSWVKPNHAENSHDVLKIQCVLEAKNATLDQVMQLAQTPRDTTVRTIAALIAAGVMPSAVYAQLKDTPLLDSVLDTIPVQTPTSPIQPSSNSTTTQANMNPPNTPTNEPEKADDGMKGFLSKLRRKLGL